MFAIRDCTNASDVSSFTCAFKETESGGGGGTVFASWFDKTAGEYHLVRVGSGEPETELEEIFSSEKAALAAANAKLKRVAKSNKTFTFSVAGRPDFFAESPIVLQDFDSKIPVRWIINKVEHALSSNGFSTRVECCSVE